MAIRVPTLRFSLRTAAIILTALCIWLGIKASAARRQHSAVASLEQAGGTVWFDYHFKKTPPTNLPNKGPTVNLWSKVDSMADPPAPRWLRRWTGDEPFQEVFRVDLHNQRIRSETFSQLEKVPEIRSLVLYCSRIVLDSDDTRPLGNDELAIIGRLKNLEELHLPDVELEASGLEHLANLTRLKRLYIRQLNDETVQPISRIASLELLEAWETRITDVGAKSFHRLRQLRWLRLGQTQLTANVMNELRTTLPGAFVSTSARPYYSSRPAGP
jgi:hypothetical protein